VATATTTTTGKFPELESKGGTTIVLIGDHFGPASTTRTAPVLFSTYCNFDNAIAGTCLPTCQYKTSSCKVLGHTKMECVTSRSNSGCKRTNLQFRATVEEQSGTFSEESIDFKRPAITGIYGSKQYLLSTEGDDSITLNGSNFGSLNESNVSAVYYGTDTDGQGIRSFTTNDCAITISDVQAKCRTVAGIGKNYSWNITIVDQTKA
jgi:hypothetical protein